MRQATAILPIFGKKVLILKRSQLASSFPDKWNFPGGKVEPGESILDGAKRELFEEAGIKAKELKFVTSIEIKKAYLKVSFYSVRLEDDLCKINEESSDFAWVTKEELFNYDLLPIDSDLKDIICSEF